MDAVADGADVCAPYLPGHEGPDETEGERHAGGAVQTEMCTGQHEEPAGCQAEQNASERVGDTVADDVERVLDRLPLRGLDRQIQELVGGLVEREAQPLVGGVGEEDGEE